jgi:hypothetical protein
VAPRVIEPRPTGELIAEHHVLVASSMPLEVQLVLERGHCYSVGVNAAHEVEADLADENGRPIASARGRRARLGPSLCPRWTGSFALRVQTREIGEVGLRVWREL